MAERDAEFLELVEHGERFYSRKGVDISFVERRAAIWGDDGPTTHAAMLTIRELRERPQFLDHPSAAWVVPLLDRLDAGGSPEALTREAIAEYTARHGEPPRTRIWTIRR